VITGHRITNQLGFHSPQYTNWLPDSDIVHSSMLQIIHSNVQRDTIRRYRPLLLCRHLLSLFWILLLLVSWNMQLQHWRVSISLFPSIQLDDKYDRPLLLSILGQFYVHGCHVGTNFSSIYILAWRIEMTSIPFHTYWHFWSRVLERAVSKLALHCCVCYK
jgi:hypothetical protein